MRSKAKKTKKTRLGGKLFNDNLIKPPGREGGEIYRLDVRMRPKAREDAKYDPHARVTA